MRGALAPRSLTDMAPLQAYNSDVLCKPNKGKQKQPVLLERYGPAALVIEDEAGYYRAFYYRTVRETVIRAQERCKSSEAGSWYVATTFPIAGYEPERRFLSMDADRIADYLRDAQSSPDQSPPSSTRSGSGPDPEPTGPVTNPPGSPQRR